MNSKDIGLILSFIGGLVSFGFFFLIPFMFAEYAEYPNFFKIVSVISLILQIMCIIGGIITILGALISVAKEEIGWIIVLIGALVGGGNIISIIGAIKLREKEKKIELDLDDQNFPKYIPSQNEELNINDQEQFMNWRNKKQEDMELGS